MIHKNTLLYVIAGEVSGDLHGGPLLKALKEKDPAFKFQGVGGDAMEAEGLESILPFRDFHVMGFIDIIRAFPRLRRHFYTLVDHILQDQPAAVVFIDYPEFNLRLAKELRRRGFKGKLIHYIAPTVWAWRANRAKSMAETLDLLLTIYPFEPAYFKSLPSKYVGNPLMNEIKTQHNWRMHAQIPEKVPVILLFPGSRPGEIERNLPLEIETAELFLKKHPTYQFVISIVHPNLEKEIQRHLEKSRLKIGINCWFLPSEHRYSAMREAEAALAKSGTVTLELALQGCPTVVLYKLSRFNAFLVRYIFRIQLPHYALPNILLNETLFPEWYGLNLPAEKLALSLEQQVGMRASVEQKTLELKQLLTNQNASETAAREIYEILP